MSIKTSVADLNTALLQRDTIALENLLHDKIKYGHSNGWTETKTEVINDLYNGKLTYKNLEMGDMDILIENNVASVRMPVKAEISLNGNEVSLNLQVLQVWIYENKKWQLFARQSVKLN